MIDHTDPLWRLLYIFLAALAGGISALAFMPVKTMLWWEIWLTVFVGTTFSLFVVPAIVQPVFGVNVDNIRFVVACCYIGAAGAFTFIPVLIKRATGAKNGGDTP